MDTPQRDLDVVPLNVISNAAAEINEKPKPLIQIGTEMDRIPVRLAKDRKAWLEIPTPFFKADKERLKAHIDLLLADDEN